MGRKPKLIGLSIGMLLIFTSCEKEYPYPQIKEKQSIKIDKNRINKSQGNKDEEGSTFTPNKPDDSDTDTSIDELLLGEEYQNLSEDIINDRDKVLLSKFELASARGDLQLFKLWKKLTQEVKPKSHEGLFRYTLPLEEGEDPNNMLAYKYIEFYFVGDVAMIARMKVPSALDGGEESSKGYSYMIERVQFEPKEKKYLISELFRASSEDIRKGHQHKLVRAYYNQAEDCVTLEFCRTKGSQTKDESYTLNRAYYPYYSPIIKQIMRKSR